MCPVENIFKLFCLMWEFLQSQWEVPFWDSVLVAPSKVKMSKKDEINTLLRLELTTYI
jgi:hypothetical protein